MSAASEQVGSVAKVTRQYMEGMEDRMQRWLRSHLPGCSGCRIGSVHASSTGGLSNETFILSLEDSPVGRVVIKKDVSEISTNPQSNFATSVKLHSVLGEIPEMRVPRLLGVELSSEVIGAPFMVIEYAAGDIPSDVPSYAASGWVCEAQTAQRQKMWQSGLDFLIRLHRFDWRSHGLEKLQFDAAGDDPLERCLNWSVRLFREEAGGRSAPIVERAIDWLSSNRPRPADECLNWGDARIGNIIWRDFECAAVIDWEMGTIGYPGIDLGWWSFFHRWSTYGQGLPDLSGTCAGQELVDLYESRGGQRIPQFRYYEVLGAIRGLSIWLRVFDAMKSQGAFADLEPLDDSVHMVRVLHQLMDGVE